MIFKGSSGGAPTWMVVFLGNPGPKYDMTRHNVGFMVGDYMAKRLDIKINRVKYHALTAVGETGGCKVLFLKPQTYMNLSGEAVAPAADFYKIPPEHIIVISDDVSLPCGKLRIRRSGSAGGHNGLKNIIAHLGTDCFPRVKVGVGAPPHPDYDMADWVLGTFKNQDAEDMQKAVERASDAVECIISQGIDRAMNKYN